MKQKIVLKVQMNCQKCRTKAMEIAASTEGVISVTIDAEKEQVVVVGEGVDSIVLTSQLRKKVGYTDLISVEEVKPEEKKEEPKKPEPEKNPPPCIPYCHPYPHPCPQFVAYETVYDPNPSICSIM
ncbi:heavy metal-associated isoprenylated plant protein 16-like [Magnolia sinica]|uniref:heavy metal-associated isoprenylated plant protein 16-like n=1 Tax=Magnolia sinica TaxID=86752 RepID=UPI00265A91C4|nr:heavy metal-associated isoprenylated plant protein 16-like [Magnolia sinica]